MSLGDWYIGLHAKEWYERRHAHHWFRAALKHGKVFASVMAKHTRKPIPIRSGKGGFGDDESQPFNPGDNLPLFNGELETALFDKFGEDAPTMLCGQGYDGFIRLSFPKFFLNPMRFIRHQPLPVGDDWGKAKWFKNPVPVSTGGEFSLMNDDNWIPSTPNWHDFAAPENWQRHLRRYVARVVKILREDFLKAMEAAGNQDSSSNFEFGGLIVVPDYKIHEVETAWEFSDSDPCERVRFLKQHLFDLGRGKFSFSVYRGELNMMRHKGEEMREFNSTGLKVNLAGGAELRVYAKTNKRVRFEIVQRNLNRKKLLEAAKIAFSADEKAYVEIPTLLKQARNTAAKMLNNTVFPAIAAEPDLRVKQRSVLGLLADLSKACENARSVRDVISLLVSNGGLQVGVPGKPLPSELAAIINKLKGKAKLVVWNKARNAYEVAPRYRWALDQLRQADHDLLSTIFGSAPPRER